MKDWQVCMENKTFSVMISKGRGRLLMICMRVTSGMKDLGLHASVIETFLDRLYDPLHMTMSIMASYWAEADADALLPVQGKLEVPELNISNVKCTHPSRIPVTEDKVWAANLTAQPGKGIYPACSF